MIPGTPEQLKEAFEEFSPANPKLKVVIPFAFKDD